MVPYRTRFAPSPTGYLHLGHVVSALYARLMAGSDGQFYVRIEDCDQVRCTDFFRTALIDDVQWLGLWPDQDVRIQSAHKAEYEGILAILRRRGLIYPCWCSRREVAENALHRAPDGGFVYNGRCRSGARSCESSESPQWRLDMQRALSLLGGEPGWMEIGPCAGRGLHKGQAAAFGDVVLARRDTGLSYHLCVTYDDAVQDINCVTRGMDIEPLTSIHRVLQKLMGWPEPVYAHHALIMDPQSGKKLSKREGAEGLRYLKTKEWSADQVRNHPLVRQALAASFAP
ncbi:tRNA glutamyl-Q(34) synthetase GluQRS [Acetobacteraceae bacterium ESL0709]|nr:tRNA glutamyl-Q(34) synthetase GluQRS [Acetobacteraceae bacterium ESL0697]MDF7678264.1 tRNA glutamyl-Q(34) synthetase GluQRS [Acetobacteraceae bacterium ESL0709]